MTATLRYARWADPLLYSYTAMFYSKMLPICFWVLRHKLYIYADNQNPDLHGRQLRAFPRKSTSVSQCFQESGKYNISIRGLSTAHPKCHQRIPKELQAFLISWLIPKAQQSVDTGTAYPCTKRDIESVTIANYHRTGDKPKLGEFLSMDKATEELEQSLSKSAQLSSSTEEALKRLRNMLLLEDKDWGPDLIVKSFNDWDKVFFNRRLKGHVFLAWNSEAFDPAIERTLYGHMVPDDVSWRWRHVKIELNADRHLLLPLEPLSMRHDEAPVSQFRGIWGSFLHECCHAYLAILTGNACDEDEENEGFDGGHGRHFQRCIHAVDRSARALLGVAAQMFYGTRENRPQKMFDIENHQIIPRNPKMPIIKSRGVRQIIKTCSHMIKVLRRA